MLNKPRGQAQSYLKYCRMRKQTKTTKIRTKEKEEEQSIVINFSTVNS